MTLRCNDFVSVGGRALRVVETLSNECTVRNVVAVGQGFARLKVYGPPATRAQLLPGTWVLASGRCGKVVVHDVDEQRVTVMLADVSVDVQASEVDVLPTALVYVLVSIDGSIKAFGCSGDRYLDGAWVGASTTIETLLASGDGEMAAWKATAGCKRVVVGGNILVTFVYCDDRVAEGSGMFLIMKWAKRDSCMTPFEIVCARMREPALHVITALGPRWHDMPTLQ